MKQLFPAAFLLVLLLLGCGKDFGETVPIEASQTESCIFITALTEPADFGAFRAGAAEDGSAARELVVEVLAGYPAGFPEQWGKVEILLTGPLTGEGRYSGGHFAGFTQRTGEGWLMVLDAGRCSAGTIHHEIAHILDGILTDAGVLTEEDWMAFCPNGFSYGQTGDYPDFFADAYAMTDIREDRARTFEDAILGGPGVYGDRPALWLKLSCFSRAIRAHFDTTGWPEKTAWELALD